MLEGAVATAAKELSVERFCERMLTGRPDAVSRNNIVMAEDAAWAPGAKRCSSGPVPLVLPQVMIGRATPRSRLTFTHASIVTEPPRLISTPANGDTIVVGTPVVRCERDTRGETAVGCPATDPCARSPATRVGSTRWMRAVILSVSVMYTTPSFSKRSLCANPSR